jgi:pyridoxine 5-phosphate synthase
MSKVKGARLGVNIDHVATLRQARGEDYPSLVEAARVSLENGADQITIHLREDRRHIQDTDVPAIKLVTERFGVPLNLELAANQEILNIAVDTAPEWVCIVPEKREERTTEGGLNLSSNEQFEIIKSACHFLKEKNPNGKVSLFVEANLSILARCAECEVDAVEIHTGDYARDFLAEEDIQKYLIQFKDAYEFLKDKKIGFHAGHGLTDESLVPLVEQGLFVEYNIGHWIICDSVFSGLGQSIKKLKNILSK